MTKKSLIIMVSVLLILLPVACVNVPSTTPTPNETQTPMLTYENSTYGIKINYPQDWIKQEASGAGGFGARFTRPQESDLDVHPENVVIQVPNMYVSDTLDEGTQKLIQELEQSSQYFKLIDSSPTTLAGNPAHKIVCTDKVGQYDQKSMFIITIKNNKSYAVLYNALSDRYSDSLRIAQQMIDSLEITPSSGK